MTLIRCDACERELDEHTTPYLRIERAGLKLMRMDAYPGPWHVCDWRCAARLAMRMPS